MSGYQGIGIVASVIGMAIGGAAVHAIDAVKLSREQRAHAIDDAANARKLADISERAAKSTSGAIAAYHAATDRIAALDQQYHHERKSHEQDNANNRAAIADGSRRLRIAVANTRSGISNDPNSTSGSMGDGASRYAELPSTIGEDLFKIVDDADVDARAKAQYLQRYVCALQARSVIAGQCLFTDDGVERLLESSD